MGNKIVLQHTHVTRTTICKLSLHSEDVILTFRHRASCIQGRRFATLQRTLFIYLINNISLSDICLTCIIYINNTDNQLDATITAY